MLSNARKPWQTPPCISDSVVPGMVVKTARVFLSPFSSVAARYQEIQPEAGGLRVGFCTVTEELCETLAPKAVYQKVYVCKTHQITWNCYIMRYKQANKFCVGEPAAFHSNCHSEQGLVPAAGGVSLPPILWPGPAALGCIGSFI